RARERAAEVLRGERVALDHRDAVPLAEIAELRRAPREDADLEPAIEQRAHRVPADEAGAAEARDVARPSGARGLRGCGQRGGSGRRGARGAARDLLADGD